MENQFVVDTETGGLDPKTDALCSVTLKQLNKKKILDLYIRPTRLKYNKKAMEVNGLTKEFLRKEGVGELAVILQIIELASSVGKRIELIGQNTQFDYHFLMELFNRHGYDMNDYISHHLRDTKVLAMALKDADCIQAERGTSLGNLYREAFGRKFANAHSSLADVKATEKLWNHYLDMLRSI